MVYICLVLLRVVLVLAVKIGFDAGAAALGFIAEGIKRLARRVRQRRRRKKRLRELGIPEEGDMAIDLGTRTSTNAFVGGTFLSQVYVQLVTLLPGEGALEQLLVTPEAVAFAAVLLAALIARFSKTPAAPKAL